MVDHRFTVTGRNDTIGGLKYPSLQTLEECCLIGKTIVQMAVEKLGEGGTEPDAGDAPVMIIGCFMNNVKGFEFVDDPDHRAFRQLRPQIDIGRR